MAEGPSFELQRAMREAMLADPRIGDMVNGAVLDGNPPSGLPPVPSVVFRSEDFDIQRFECVRIWRITHTLDTWRGTNGRKWPVAELNQAIVQAMEERLLDLPSYGTVSVDIELVTANLDADGLTGHGVISMTAEVEEPIAEKLRHG